MSEVHGLVASRALLRRRPAVSAHRGKQRRLRRGRQEAAAQVQARDHGVRSNAAARLLLLAVRAERSTQRSLLRATGGAAHAPAGREGRIVYR